LENRLGDEELYRMERRLDDDTRYLQDTEVLDADLRDSVLDDYDGYPDVALQNDLVRTEMDEDYLERDRFERDVLY
jgi:hypothetical protein